MLIIEIILIILLLGFIGAGSKDGFVHTAGRLIGAILGFIAARAWYLSFAPILDIFMPTSWARIISFLLIFIFISRVAGILFKLIDGAFHVLSILPFLKSINSLLGGILGFFEGLIILGGAIYLILTFTLEPTLVMWLKGSTVAGWIEAVFIALLGILL
ncbi:MAG: CvpA family protein [Patescibacteria group bacterium]